jgi:hypothetical protein
MFNVTFTNGVDDLVLTFKLRDTDIANKWFSELSKNYELYETDRFSNWGQQDYPERLNEQIDIINSYENIIDKKITKDTNQQELNYLHKFFEDLRGEVVNETEWFKNAPNHVKDAVCKFNILIHQLESELRTKGKHPTVVITFNNRPRFELTVDEYKHFTYCWTSGTVYINYCHVGKTVLDVFKDRDHLSEAVRPQTHYSADFMIKFGPSTNRFVYFARSIIIKLWLLKQNFKFKHLNIGMIPVADLQTTVDKSTLLKFNKVKSVECLK